MPLRILLTFANENPGRAHYLRALPEEVRALKSALEPARQAALCESELETNVDVERLVELLQDEARRRALVIFHYAGHADGDGIFLEGRARPEAAHAAGLAGMLGACPALVLVFLNGCSTGPQVQALLDQGIPAVIATGRSIDDGAATRFAQVFYQRLAGGRAIGEAFRDAEAAVKTGFGDRLYRDLPDDPGAGDPPQTRMGRRRGPSLDGVPWALHLEPGAEHIRDWSLPLAAGDPLFGLPAVGEGDLPPSPFPHLARYQRPDREIFFGRRRETRQLYDALTEPGRAPVVVLYGPTGAGKSSLLEAGVLPRLEDRCDVVSLRRDRAVGLLTELRAALGLASDGGGDAELRAAWLAREAERGRPLIVLLDQVEEIFTRPRPREEDELGALIRGLVAVFGKEAERPRGRVLLGLRTEWAATVSDQLAEARLYVKRIALEHLDPGQIRDIVRGPAGPGRVGEHYGLTIEPGLADEIATDLSADVDAAIAPTLAILLAKLWTRAIRADDAAPRFTRADYLRVAREGLHLDDFIGHQLAPGDTASAGRRAGLESGLILDVLAHHTTPLGTAQVHEADALVARYAHRPELPALLADLADRRLLSGTLRVEGGALVGTSRLAHDTLGPLIRRRFERSDAPGQRAARVLQARVVDWRGGASGGPLGRVDLETVEAGRAGMPALDADEARLVRESHVAVERQARSQRFLRGLGIAGLAALLVGAVVGWVFWDRAVDARADAEAQTAVAVAQTAEAQAQRRKAKDALLLIAAQAARAEDPTLAALLLTEIAAPDEMAALQQLVDLAAEPGLAEAVLEHPGEISDAALSPDGRSVAIAAWDPPVRIWTFGDEGVSVADREPVESAQRVEFTADGEWITVAGSGDIAEMFRLDDPMSSRRVWPKDAGPYRDKPTISHDGERLMVRVARDATLVWRVDGRGAPVLLADPGSEMAWAVFSRDGRRVMTPADRGVRVWNAERAGDPVLFEGDARQARLSPDGARVLTVPADGEACISSVDDPTWHVDVDDFAAGVTCWPTRPWNDAAFSPDGGRVALLHDGGSVSLIRADGPGEVRVLEAGGGDDLRRAEFSPDGAHIIRYGRDLAEVWRSDGAGSPVVLRGHRGFIDSVRFSPDGRRVLTIVTLGNDKSARLWRFGGSTEPMVVVPWGEAREPVALSPDGQRVVARAGDAVSVWRTDGSREPLVLQGLDGSFESASFSPDGRWIVAKSAEPGVQIYRADGDGAPDSLSGIRRSRDPDAFIELAVFSPDGRRVLIAEGHRAGPASSVLRVLTLGGTGEPVPLSGMPRYARFSPDGSRLLVAEQARTRVWPTDAFGEPSAFESCWEGCVATLGPDGRRLLMVEQGHAFLWHLDRVGEPVTLRMDVERGAFGPHGLLALGTRRGLLVLDLDGAGSPVLLGPAPGLLSVAFSPDGQRVLTTDAAGAVRVWRADGVGQPVELFRSGDEHEAVFSPDGKRVTALTRNVNGREGAVRVWTVDGEALQQQLDDRIRWCVPAAFRRQRLGETAAEATAAERACRARKGLPPALAAQ